MYIYRVKYTHTLICGSCYLICWSSVFSSIYDSAARETPPYIYTLIHMRMSTIHIFSCEPRIVSCAMMAMSKRKKNVIRNQHTHQYTHTQILMSLCGWVWMLSLLLLLLLAARSAFIVFSPLFISPSDSVFSISLYACVYEFLFLFNGFFLYSGLELNVSQSSHSVASSYYHHNYSNNNNNNLDT